MLKKILLPVLNAIAPSITNNRYLKSHTLAEPEIALLPALVPPNKLAIDVGANRGLYVHHLSGIASRVVAFEPLPPMQQWLKRNYPKLDLHHTALSDSAGTALIRYPKGWFSWATLADSNDLGLASMEIEECEVELRTLDSYAFDNVGFIKIDVEGYEDAVLRGSEQTLKQLPVILIEVEDRHNPGSPKKIRDFLDDHGYDGFFLDESRIASVQQFDPAIDARIENVSTSGKSGRYINNFIYLPRDKSKEIVGRIEAMLALANKPGITRHGFN